MKNDITKVCNICGKLPFETLTKRLVRDHNHKTNYIRGLLCDDCNQKLGTYESKNKYIHHFKNKRYKIWVKIYLCRIEIHLLSNTGVKYHGITNLPPGTISGKIPLPKLHVI